jgi:hypothetical protein
MNDPIVGVIGAVVALAWLQQYLPRTRSFQRRQARDRLEQARIREELGLTTDPGTRSQQWD